MKIYLLPGEDYVAYCRALSLELTQQQSNKVSSEPVALTVYMSIDRGL